MSIRARLLLLILFATLIPALMSGFHFVERRDAEVTEAAHRLSAEAGRVAHELKDMVRGTAQLHYGLSRARPIVVLNCRFKPADLRTAVLRPV